MSHATRDLALNIKIMAKLPSEYTFYCARRIIATWIVDEPIRTFPHAFIRVENLQVDLELKP